MRFGRTSLRSLRARLTLWNLAVLALSLALFGGILVAGNERRLRSEIDHELLARARGAMRAPFPPEPPQRPRQTFDEPGEMGRERPPRDRPWPGPPPGEEPSFGLRRVLFIDAAGKVLRPQDVASPIDRDAAISVRGGRERFTTVSVDGVPVRVLTLPWRRDGEIQGAIQAARDLSDVEAFQRSILWTFLALLPVAIGVAGVGAAFLTTRALRPVGALSRAAEEIRATDLERRLPVVGFDEFAELSSTLNRMIERLQASFAEIEEAKRQVEAALDNQRRFSADASHELRTPLTRLKLATSGLLSEGGLSDAHQAAVRVADESADAMSRLVHQLLMLSRADAGELGLALSPVDIRVVASDAADSFPGVEPARIAVELPEREVMVLGDADHLGRLIANLLENALRHTEPSALVALSIESRGGHALVIVRDEGTGIPKEDLPHVFERFYRVDKARTRSDGGCGLGLAICESIARAHGGSITIESELGRGTCVTVTIPELSAKT